MITRISLLIPLLAVAGCAAHEKAIAAATTQYRSDTELANRLLEPLGVEPPHGQVSVALSRKFAEKLLVASLEPNVLTVNVAEGGRLYRQEVAKLGMKFDNGVWLDGGRVDLAFHAHDLLLEGDILAMDATVSGLGTLQASAKFFGFGAQRQLEMQTRFADRLRFQLIQGESTWLLRTLGPVKLQVDLKLPAFTIAGVDLVPLSFSRELEFETDSLKTWELPPPTPHAVNVGSRQVRIGLRNMQLGTRPNVIWLGGDLLVEGVEEVVTPAVATEPVTPTSEAAATPSATTTAPVAPAATGAPVAPGGTTAPVPATPAPENAPVPVAPAR